MSIQRFDRANLRLIAEDIRAALEPIASKWGIQLDYGGSSFLPDKATIKVIAFIPSAEAPSPDAAEFKRYATVYGLEPGDLGRSFNHHGHQFTITGLAPKSRRFPVVCEREDGKGFKFPVRTILLALGRPTVGIL